MAACARLESLCAGFLAPFRIGENALTFMLPPVAGRNLTAAFSDQRVSGHAPVSLRAAVRVLVSMLLPAPCRWQSALGSFLFRLQGGPSHKTLDCPWQPATATSRPEPDREANLCRLVCRPCRGATAHPGFPALRKAAA